MSAAVHEVKNSLGILFSRLDSIEQRLCNDTSFDKPLADIKSQANLVTNQISSILTHYKQYKNINTLNYQQHFIVDFFEECVARHIITAKSYQFELDFVADDNLEHFFDEDLIRLVIDTAIFNAAKENVKKITLTAETQNDFLALEIHDDGVGYPQDVLNAFKTNEVIQSHSQSTGLGLSLASNIAHAHQHNDISGYISLDRSKRLGGAQLSIYIP